MATCLHCEHRKGKRSCPALAGAICATCCGQHRLRDIDCPTGCVHLGGLSVAREPAPAGFSAADLTAAMDKLLAYADRAREFRNEALSRVIQDLDYSTWERELATGYLYYSHRDAGGRRLIDHFIAARGRDLPRGEMAAAIALRDSWASLFEVVSVHAGAALELRDLRSGELHRAPELPATAQVQPGDVMFTWVMPLADHLVLTGIACLIPPQHRERVRAAIEAELAATRARWPGTPERELVGATAWVVAAAMRTATYDASRAPAPDEWLATGDAPKLAAIEAHHRTLGVTAPMHAALHLIVENQLAAGDPPEARAALDRLVEEGLDRHEAIHAIGSVVATALWSILLMEAPLDRDAMVRSLAELRASDWREERADTAASFPALPEAIPPFVHR